MSCLRVNEHSAALHPKIHSSSDHIFIKLIHSFAINFSGQKNLKICIDLEKYQCRERYGWNYPLTLCLSGEFDSNPLQFARLSVSVCDRLSSSWRPDSSWRVILLFVSWTVRITCQLVAAGPRRFPSADSAPVMDSPANKNNLSWQLAAQRQ